MILILRISSMLALALACVLLAVAAVHWCGDGPQSARLQEMPAVADRLARIAARSAEASSATSPLMVQAQAFADHLTPSKAPEPAPAAQDPALAENTPAAPTVPAATLKLHATSCYPDHPEKSMALVSAAGGQTQEQRWVKEGSRLGSFHIHEIRRGGIIYREGDVLHEVAIEPGAERPSIVRDTRIGSHEVLAAAGDALRPAPGVADPNHIEITGN